MRFVFRLLYGALLAAVFVGAVWFGFRQAIVGRSVTVPDLTGKTPQEAMGAARAVGLQLEEQGSRARYDERIARGRSFATSVGDYRRAGLVLDLDGKALVHQFLAGNPGRPLDIEVGQLVLRGGIESLEAEGLGSLRQPGLRRLGRPAGPELRACRGAARAA